ncbi:MAG: hypothetical protein R3C60_10275, partial [Parvularculaceae bacterium]
MILRRITSAFKKQDWFTVGIETLIVVLGVFLGLQANNWNAAREDRHKEHQILLNLQTDFTSLATEQQDRADTIKQDFVKGRMLYRIGINRAVPPGEAAEAAAAFTSLNFMRAPLPASSTYEEIAASGQVGLIRNAQLRRALADYDSTRKRYDVFYPLLSGWLVDIIKTVGKYMKLDPASIPKEIGEFPSVGSIDWTALKTDPEFALYLQTLPNVKTS